MTAEESLQIVLESMEQHGIDYMIAGSFASNIHGVPRTTYDADIVIESEKQFQDAVGIAKVQEDNLDLDYLKMWANRLGLSDLLADVLRQAGLGSQSDSKSGEE